MTSRPLRSSSMVSRLDYTTYPYTLHALCGTLQNFPGIHALSMFHPCSTLSSWRQDLIALLLYPIFPHGVPLSFAGLLRSGILNPISFPMLILNLVCHQGESSPPSQLYISWGYPQQQEGNSQYQPTTSPPSSPTIELTAVDNSNNGHRDILIPGQRV